MPRQWQYWNMLWCLNELANLCWELYKPNIYRFHLRFSLIFVHSDIIIYIYIWHHGHMLFIRRVLSGFSGNLIKLFYCMSLLVACCKANITIIAHYMTRKLSWSIFAKNLDDAFLLMNCFACRMMQTQTDPVDKCLNLYYVKSSMSNKMYVLKVWPTDYGKMLLNIDVVDLGHMVDVVCMSGLDSYYKIYFYHW